VNDLGRTDRSVSVEMVDVEERILREIADPRMKRRDVALTYAFGVRQTGAVYGTTEQIDWPKVNRAIIDRWSLSALKWIKEEAWAYVEGRREP